MKITDRDIFHLGRAQGTLSRANPEGRVKFKLERESLDL